MVDSVHVYVTMHAVPVPEKECTYYYTCILYSYDVHVHVHVHVRTFPWLLGYGADSAANEPRHSRRRTLPRTVPEEEGAGSHDPQPYLGT